MVASQEAPSCDCNDTHAVETGSYKKSTKEIKGVYEHVIIGAGTTASAAIDAIAKNKPNPDILVVSNDVPHEHPMQSLSPAFLHSYCEWRRHISDRPEVEHGEKSASTPVTVYLNDGKDMRIDLDRKRLLFDDGTYVKYGKCLVASAGRPRGLGTSDREYMPEVLRHRINLASELEDFLELDQLHNKMANKQVAIVGGGFLATEVALALAVRGRETGMQVSQIYAEQAPLARFLPLYLAQHVQRLMHGAGVRGISERLVTDVEGADDAEEGEGALQMSLMGWNRESLNTDFVVLVAWNGVAWLGPVAMASVDNCIETARKSGLEIDSKNGGIVVNQQLEALAGVFVAGGVASYYDSALGRRRVEMYDHSINSGKLAGHNMSTDEAAPQRKRYSHQPAFRSVMKDVDVTCACVGEINSSLRTVGVWVDSRRDQRPSSGSGSSSDKRPSMDFQRGIVYYLDENDRIKGILLWNASENLERAREVLRTQPIVSGPDALKRFISLAPDSWLKIIETGAPY